MASRSRDRTTADRHRQDCAADDSGTRPRKWSVVLAPGVGRPGIPMNPDGTTVLKGTCLRENPCSGDDRLMRVPLPLRDEGAWTALEGAAPLGVHVSGGG